MAEVRKPMREDNDSKTRAAQRAKELREHLGDLDDGTDDFYVDPQSIPEGWTYEWKRHSTYGQEDPAYQVQLARAGWTPVPVDRHPDMMPVGTSDKTIMRKGLLLMECPTEIVDDRKRIDQKNAREQVRHKEAQIAGAPDGQFTRDHAQARPKISKSYEAIPVPKD